ncbi:hypothetical protein, conserved [Leishmania tarentolae]|uniref:CCDC81 HU domain-containing protein n=1 Tax=Leishmania tarentolae TaxID=5689 RepID=A0A640KW00_LEITA|nr:hypothetical protein, conserved [Leishmania tarentolae]
MLSSRGAITTNVALAECAAGQNKSDKSVFLLSELEKVWVAVAVVARRLLLDGSAVQIAPFGALWTEEYVLLRDRQQSPYKTRKLCFGINLNFANRYGVDTGKVPLERPGGEGYVRVSMADIVAVCGVPAHIASAALKEFFLYLGEGLSRGRVFQLSLPGVATISMKKQKVVLSMDGELCIDMYEIDSRKWPVELQREGYEALQRQAGTVASSAFSSVAASRPSTSRLSRTSWRATPASRAGSVTAGEGVEARKPIFIAASPSGRLFDEIAQQAEQRRKASHSAAAAERQMRRLQEDLDRRIERYDEFRCYIDPVENTVNYTEADDESSVHDELQRVDLPPPSGSGESVYNIISRSNPQHKAPAPNTSHQYVRRHPRSTSSTSSHHHGVSDNDEPEVEVIEIVDPVMENPPSIQTEKRPLPHKDAELERILRDEETFSRPISRRTYHESSAARDLIYSQPYEAPSRRGDSAAIAGLSPTAYRKKTASIETSAHTTTLTTATEPGQTHEDVPRFGRKRFDSQQCSSDHIGSLLQYREY